MRRKERPIKKPPIIHPFLLALFPIAFLFAHNIEMIFISEILLPSAVMLGFAALALLLLTPLLGDGGRAGIVVSLFWVLFFSYGHVAHLAEQRLGGDFRHGYLLFAWALLLVGGVCATLRIRDAGRWTLLLNVVALALLVPSLVKVGTYQLEARRIKQTASPPPAEQAGANPGEAGHEDLPDIYYIVPDRYASATTLERHFDFDNSEFLDALADRGFYVADESYANYPKTFLSLASSLNMKHLTSLTDELGREASNQTIVYEMLQDYEVWRFLKARGYTFMHFGTGWEPTRYNRYADKNFVVWPAEFSMMLYQTTMLEPIGVELNILNEREMQRRAIEKKFDTLAQMPEKEGPKFVFAHLLLPHHPYVFDPEGERLPEEEVEGMTEAEKYLSQLAFANQKLSWLIDQILEKSERPPIIILQSDEGPFIPFHLEYGGAGTDWRQLDDEAIRTHMRILNAYHLPGVDADEILYPSITPVNTFRVILDHYFGTDHGLVEDKCYIIEDTLHPYAFIDVTDMVRYE